MQAHPPEGWDAPRCQPAGARPWHRGGRGALCRTLLVMLLLAPWLVPRHAMAGDAPAPAGNAPAPTADLQPFQASYVWIWHGAPIALSNLRLQHREDDTWVYDSTTRPRGIGRLYPMRPVLHSVMRITPQGVQPLQFVATGSGARHDADVTFDWTGNRATGIYEGAKVDLSIHPGVQDDLSVQIAMLSQLLAGRTPAAVMEINKDAVREYDYDRAGEETLDTALGPLDTVVYVSHAPGSPRTTSFWCAPSLGFIPVQVQQKRLDKVEWTMRIRSLTGKP